MRITTALLKKYKACEKEVERFAKAYPNGIEANGENAVLLSAEGFDVLWATRLLSKEGPGSQRAFALWCVEQVAHLNTNPKVKKCLKTVRREILRPGSQNITNAVRIATQAIQNARAVAEDVAHAVHSATRATAHDIAWVAYEAAWASRGAATVYTRDSAHGARWDSQLFMLGEMLREL